MEGPEEFYRELEKMKLQFRDLGYNPLKLIEAYHRAGAPFGDRRRLPPLGAVPAVDDGELILSRFAQ